MAINGALRCVRRSGRRRRDEGGGGETGEERGRQRWIYQAGRPQACRIDDVSPPRTIVQWRREPAESRDLICFPRDAGRGKRHGAARLGRFTVHCFTPSSIGTVAGRRRVADELAPGASPPRRSWPDPGALTRAHASGHYGRAAEFGSCSHRGSASNGDKRAQRPFIIQRDGETERGRDMDGRTSLRSRRAGGAESERPRGMRAGARPWPGLTRLRGVGGRVADADAAVVVRLVLFAVVKCFVRPSICGAERRCSSSRRTREQ